jgi:hypothetical protein
MLANSAAASAGATPVLKRAKAPTSWKRRSVVWRALKTQGIQTSDRPTTDASGGMMPTTVYGWPSIRTVEPTTVSAAPKVWRQMRALSSATRPSPRRSPGASVRPRSACSPHTSK